MPAAEAASGASEGSLVLALRLLRMSAWFICSPRPLSAVLSQLGSMVQQWARLYKFFVRLRLKLKRLAAAMALEARRGQIRLLHGRS
jgi:hypothetical protein